jgi:lipoprotein signal peptidase
MADIQLQSLETPKFAASLGNYTVLLNRGIAFSILQEHWRRRWSGKSMQAANSIKRFVCFHLTLWIRSSPLRTMSAGGEGG